MPREFDLAKERCDFTELPIIKCRCQMCQFFQWCQSGALEEIAEHLDDMNDPADWWKGEKE